MTAHIHSTLFQPAISSQEAKKLSDIKANQNSSLLRPAELKMAKELQFPLQKNGIDNCHYAALAVSELEARVFKAVSDELKILTANVKNSPKEMQAFVEDAIAYTNKFGNRHEAISKWFDALLDIEMNPTVAKNRSVQKISALLQEGQKLWHKFTYGYSNSEEDSKLLQVLGARRLAEQTRVKAAPTVCRP